ncbi:MAG: hypothetical protein J6U54_19510 [Clostridiales bacterium]|nr:hypothetical protein [Clostridiales bacterium]
MPAHGISGSRSVGSPAGLFPAQKEWVKQMEENYTDDTFTFTGKTHRKYETRKIWTDR